MTDRNDRTDTDEATARTMVDSLLMAAGVTVPDEEVARLASLYPGLRRSADRFHQVDVGDEVPAALFDAGEPMTGRNVR